MKGWHVVGLYVVIFGAAGAWLVYGMWSVRDVANRMTSAGRLKQLGVALHCYHQDHGHFPPAYIADADGRPMHSWRVLILPYIEAESLYKEYRFDEPWDGPNNRKLASRKPTGYRTPRASGEEGDATVNYLAVVGPGTAWPGTGKVSFDDVTDDRGSTILLVENEGASVHWMEPRDLSFADMDFAVGSPNGVSSPFRRAQVVTVDGNVRSLEPTIRPEALRALFTIRGGERVEDGPAGWQLIPDGRDRLLR